MLTIIPFRIFIFPCFVLKSTNSDIQNYNVTLCGYETWSFTVREEWELGTFENGVFRRIFDP
jgi:hypothetical protein